LQSTVSIHFPISGGITSCPCLLLLLLLSVLLLLQAPRNSTTGDHVAPGGERG
jgi:competence protein ComGC